LQQKIRDASETKKYTILLTLILLINTVIIIVVANNKTSNKVNELEDNLYEYELPDLYYEKPSSDYLADIIDDQPFIELDDLIEKNSQQNNYTLSESADKAMVIPDETNQAQDED
jgi:hypothetical protein